MGLSQDNRYRKITHYCATVLGIQSITQFLIPLLWQGTGRGPSLTYCSNVFSGAPKGNGRRISEIIWTYPSTEKKQAISNTTPLYFQLHSFGMVAKASILVCLRPFWRHCRQIPFENPIWTKTCFWVAKTQYRNPKKNFREIRNAVHKQNLKMKSSGKLVDSKMKLIHTLWLFDDCAGNLDFVKRIIGILIRTLH